MKAFFKTFSWLVFLLFVSTFLCFSILYYAKGSVVFAKTPQAVSLEVKKQIEENLNLNKPLLEQYFSWAKKALKGDFSYSLISGEKVSKLFFELLPNTLILALSSFILLFLFSLALGLLSLFFRNGFVDKFLNYLSMSFFALPNFALALLFILCFSFIFKLLPAFGVSDLGFENDISNRISHLILPVSVLVLSHLAPYLRFIRTLLIESFNQSFIQGALARGLSFKRIYFHFILKHTFGSFLTFFAANLVSFIMSIYVIENVFAYAGIGNLIIQSIIFKDYPVVLLLMIFSILLVFFVNSFVKFLCVLINPRLN